VCDWYFIKDRLIYKKIRCKKRWNILYKANEMIYIDLKNLEKGLKSNINSDKS